MSKINARDKGKRFEYEIRNQLKTLDPKARRSIMSGGVGQYIRSDEGDIATDLPISVECKHRETIALYEWWEQATTQNTNPDKIPVLCVKKNNFQPLACVKVEDFIELLGFALKGGYFPNSVTVQKPKRKVKQSIEETANLPFSKKLQTRRAVK